MAMLLLMKKTRVNVLYVMEVMVCYEVEDDVKWWFCALLSQGEKETLHEMLKNAGNWPLVCSIVDLNYAIGNSSKEGKKKGRRKHFKKEKVVGRGGLWPMLMHNKFLLVMTIWFRNW